MNRLLKDFLFQKMYYQFRVVRMAKRAERFIHEIFNSYVAEPRQLPDEYQRQAAHNDLYRVIADYIASMTDRGATLEYRRLFDPLMRP
jgi:dGTPase